MKTKITLLFSAVLFSLNQLHAQAPQLINYQSVVRSANGNPVSGGTVVSLRFIIHDQTEGGNSVFTETQSDTANQFGLVNTKIGVSGSLNLVSWGTGPKYLEVDLDATGGVNYVPMGNTQLLSVPYALYAANSQSGPQGPTGVAGAAGVTGVAGATGANGLNGATGLPGITGATGANGLIGATGVAGSTGVNGAIGATGLTGPSGQNGATGAAGSTGTNGAIGATGLTGPSGQMGVAGAMGLTGAIGATGTDGITGATGLLSAGSGPGNTTYWDGTQWVLTSANLYNDGANIGIGTTSPSYSLQVIGTTSTTNFQMTNGASVGYVLQTDAVGNATWVLPSAAVTAGNGLSYSNDTLNSLWSASGNNIYNNNSSSVDIGNTNTLAPLDVKASGGKDVLLTGGSATGSELKFLYDGVSHFSIYNAGDGNLTIANTSAVSLGNTTGSALVAITSGGYVGIGTTSPVVPLQVNLATASTPYSSTDVNIAHLLSNNSSVLTGNGPLSIVDAYVAISAQGDIVAQGTIAVASSVTYSDERIKNIIGQSDAAKDLDVLNKIKITDYTMKDNLWWGNTPFKKVVAQQVEQVYPQAVSRKTDFIPNIYAFTTKVEKTENGYLLTLDKALPELKTQKIRLEVQGAGRVEANFIAITAANQLLVSTPTDITKSPVFVFGAQVDDFRTVDYEAIAMLNVSATQELTKQLKESQDRLKQLEAENEKLKSSTTGQLEINKTQSEMMKSMKAQIDLITEQLNLTTHK